MADYGFKISYNAAHRRVRFEFKAIACHELDAPPVGILAKAKSKMEAELNIGHIEQYLLYDERLGALWKAVKANTTRVQAAAEVVSVTIAGGGPVMKGCIVSAPKDSSALYNLTFKGHSNEITNWNFDWLKLHINIERHRLNIQTRGNITQILAAWLRASAGAAVEQLPISAVPEQVPGQDKPFRIIGNKQRGEASLVIFQHRLFSDKLGLGALLNVGAEAARTISEHSGGIPYAFRKAELVESLKAAIAGPERYGVDMPLCILVATQGSATAVKPRLAPEASLAKKTPILPPTKSAPLLKPVAMAVPADYVGIGILPLVVSTNGMEAAVGNWNMATYNKGFSPDINWLTYEAARIGIVHGITPENMRRITDAVARKKDISGYQLAVGTVGSAGHQPYLYAVYKDRQKAKQQSESAEKNLRESQSATPVASDELIAEIRYQMPSVLPRDVYGRQLPELPAEVLKVTVGAGVEERKGGCYYATMPGMPIVAAAEVSIAKIYIHEGDVNLKSGNIYFDGPAEIRGSIDTGSTVVVSGDLKVSGQILAAFVRVGGSIQVLQGICTTEKGRVQAKQNIEAPFCENSNITCGGNLFVKRSVTNCNVIVGGNIELDQGSGIVAGGVVCCRNFLRTAKLGFPKGAKTTVNVGVDWRVQQAVRIRQGRLGRMELANAEDRLALRELVRKKKEQMTARHQEMLERLQDRLQRQREILIKLATHLKNAEALLTWDKDALIYCYDVLSANVELNVGGNVVPVPGDFKGVIVSTKRRRGSFICSLTEPDQEDKGKAS